MIDSAPFKIKADDIEIRRFRDKVMGFTWPDMPDVEGWSQGTSKTYLEETLRLLGRGIGLADT